MSFLSSLTKLLGNAVHEVEHPFGLGESRPAPNAPHPLDSGVGIPIPPRQQFKQYQPIPPLQQLLQPLGNLHRVDEPLGYFGPYDDNAFHSSNSLKNYYEQHPSLGVDNIPSMKFNSFPTLPDTQIRAGYAHQIPRII